MLQRIKLYHLRKKFIKNYKQKKMDYIQPQYNHNGWGILAKVKLLRDSLIEDIEIDWTQINNEEAMIIYEIKFKK